MILYYLVIISLFFFFQLTFFFSIQKLKNPFWNVFLDLKQFVFHLFFISYHLPQYFICLHQYFCNPMCWFRLFFNFWILDFVFFQHLHPKKALEGNHFPAYTYILDKAVILLPGFILEKVNSLLNSCRSIKIANINYFSWSEAQKIKKKASGLGPDIYIYMFFFYTHNSL